MIITPTGNKMIRFLLGIMSENLAIVGGMSIYNNKRQQEEPNATKLKSNGIANFKILFLINTHLSMSQHFRNRQIKALRFAQRPLSLKYTSDALIIKILACDSFFE